MFVRGALPLREAVHSAFRCEQRVTADSAGGAPGAARSGGVQWVGSPFWPCVLSLHFIAQLRSTPSPPPPTPSNPCLALWSDLAVPSRPRTGVIWDERASGLSGPACSSGKWTVLTFQGSQEGRLKKAVCVQ